jgi:GH24 family phage-related lysozyme (muramidase)
MATYLEQSLGMLEQFEGSIPWMYLDTSGNVTTGVGLLLADVAAAQRLHFFIGDRPATAEEIATEFARVHAMAMGRPAQFYHRDGATALQQADIDALLRHVLLGFEADLRAALKDYDSFPDGVKMALLDMAYNLGPDGLLKGYPRLIRAIEAGDWAKAADNCFRHGPGAARNQWTRKMLLGTVVGTVVGAAGATGDGALKQTCFGLIGLTATLVAKLRGR